MQTQTEDTHKVEITKRLRLTKSQIERIILAVELESNWKAIHEQTETAIFQLRKATKLLAQYHLETCIVGKHHNMNTPIVQEDIEEIIKTYMYLN